MLSGDTENELILAAGDAEEERISFKKPEDVFYKGHVTSYQRGDKTGTIDDTYMFRAEDCVGLTARRELLRNSEYEYGVCCHLVVIQDKLSAGGVRVVAKDVRLEQEPHHVLPMQVLSQEVFFV